MFSHLLLLVQVGFEGRKRKLDDVSADVLVPRFDTCSHCGEEFNVTLNKGEVCSWHVGTKEMFEDASIWGDFEDDREGQTRYETSDIPDYAEGWQWTCCGKLGDEEGCLKGPHAGKQYFKGGLNDNEDEEGRS